MLYLTIIYYYLLLFNKIFSFIAPLQPMEPLPLKSCTERIYKIASSYKNAKDAVHLEK